MLDVNNERVFEDHCLLQKGEASPLHPRAVSAIIPGNDFQKFGFQRRLFWPGGAHGPDHPVNQCWQHCLVGGLGAGGRRYTALAVLNRRLATGEIGRAEYEEKRELIGR
jgi:hypothetical protein